MAINLKTTEYPCQLHLLPEKLFHRIFLRLYYTGRHWELSSRPLSQTGKQRAAPQMHLEHYHL